MGKIEKLKNVEFLRFIFSIGIVFFHVIRWLGKPFLSDVSIFNFLYVNNWSAICVEFFFIVSGFFLITTTDFSISFGDFVKRKIIRLLPVLWCSITVYFILSLFTSLVYSKWNNIFALLLCNNLGISHTVGNIIPSWFVSSLFWGGLFYFFIVKYTSKNWINFIISVIIILLFSFLSHANMNCAFSKNFGYMFNAGMLRALAGMGLGYLLGVEYLQYKDFVIKYQEKFITKILFTVGEIYLFSFLLYYLTFHRIKAADSYMIYIFAFSGLFGLFILKRGYFSRLLNNDFSVILGRYSYSIFIMHTIVLDLFKVYLWQQHKNFIIAYPVLNLILPVVASILLGIVTYHLVEKPAAEFLKKKWFPKKICRYAEKPHPELLLPRGGVVYRLVFACS